MNIFLLESTFPHESILLLFFLCVISHSLSVCEEGNASERFNMKVQLFVLQQLYRLLDFQSSDTTCTTVCWNRTPAVAGTPNLG